MPRARHKDLFSAACCGNAAAVTRLLQEGADANWVGPEHGCTPLYTACQEGNEACARLLLEASAAVNAAADELGAGATLDALVRLALRKAAK